MRSIFREYDIRGRYGIELTKEAVKTIGYFLGLEIVSRSQKPAHVALGYDARTHSPILRGWLTSGLKKAGLKVMDMGMVPTGVNYFANFVAFDGITPSASIMITGSHNPPEYNGFKITIDKKPFFGQEIYDLGEKVMAGASMPIEDDEAANAIDAKGQYIRYMAEQFRGLKGVDKRFVFDCGNGVAGVVLEDILKELGIASKLLFKEPDGTFPNHHPDPSEEENLEDIKHELLSGDFDFGFAYDGDADRIAVLSKKYNFKGDILALFFAKNMKNPVVVGEVKCSQIMYDEINKIGRAIMYKTGHSNLKVKIKETDADLGAEVSGHLFFNDRYFGYDDAIYATFRAIELIQKGFDFDKEFEKLPKLYSTEEIKVKTTEEKKFPLVAKLKELLQNPPADFPKIREIITIDGVRVIFEDGWGLVRASNTTPVLVTRFEATTEQKAKEYEKRLNELIQRADALISLLH